jgi:hypothetical protein
MLPFVAPSRALPASLAVFLGPLKIPLGEIARKIKIPESAPSLGWGSPPKSFQCLSGESAIAINGNRLDISRLFQNGQAVAGTSLSVTDSSPL